MWECAVELRCATAALLLLFVIVPALCACCRRRKKKSRKPAQQGAGGSAQAKAASASHSAASPDGGQQAQRASDQCATPSPFSADRDTYASDDAAAKRERKQQPAAAQQGHNGDDKDTLRSDSIIGDKAAEGGGGNAGGSGHTSDFNPTHWEQFEQQHSYRTAVSKPRNRRSMPTQQRTAAAAAHARKRHTWRSSPSAAPFWRSDEPAPRCHCKSHRQHKRHTSRHSSTPFWRHRDNDNAQAAQLPHRNRWAQATELKFWKHK